MLVGNHPAMAAGVSATTRGKKQGGAPVDADPNRYCRLNPSVAKAGGVQSQGAKGEAVVIYCDPLATQDLGAAGFPGRVKK